MKWRTGSYYHKGNSKLCFGTPEIISGTPKQLAARLKARGRLHSKVVAPGSGKTGTEMPKWTVFYIQTGSLERITAEKENGFYLWLTLSQPVFFHLAI
uniref:hypothetical protein n=1 Tax=Parabacteroides johnsonii TaxID=387661 RepID=UPI00266C72E4